MRAKLVAGANAKFVVPALSRFTAWQRRGAADKVTQDARFEFGRNWARFLRVLNDDRLRMARESLQGMLGTTDLAGRTFLDAGSGSGLFSLAAAQLGAAGIVSFDYDRQSVACTQELKRRYYAEFDRWIIQQGDCLDRAYLETIPQFDVVYSWGVLHHTGDMWQAIDNIGRKVKPGGLFFVALYNDQGWQSNVWHAIKRSYCRGTFARAVIIAIFVPLLVFAGLARDLLRLRSPLARYRRPTLRGMSIVRDWFDWLGGYPFEVARPDDVKRFLGDRGFQIVRESLVGRRMGCNEFVFVRESP